MSELQTTPLFAAHERLGARMVEFAGFSMPVQYTSILREHAAVRETAGLFDVSHMGQIALRGPRAAEAADRLLTRATLDLAVGRVRYALLCNERGGVVDDVTVYRRAETDVMLCVNAANTAKDLAWVREHVGDAAEVIDESAATALLALQGPASAEVLGRVTSGEPAGMKRFRSTSLEVAGRGVQISRTGYTGADGFEIYCAAEDAVALFDHLLAEGESLGLVPAGLGARDTLRLEAALPLYGHELDDETSPLDAGLARFVTLEGREFIGAEALRRARDAGSERTLVGFVLEARGIARAGHEISHEGEIVGAVTSAGPSPTLGKSIGLAYVRPRISGVGAAFDVVIRGRAVPARVVETPFVRGQAAGRRS